MIMFWYVKGNQSSISITFFGASTPWMGTSVIEKQKMVSWFVGGTGAATASELIEEN